MKKFNFLFNRVMRIVETSILVIAVSSVITLFYFGNKIISEEYLNFFELDLNHTNDALNVYNTNLMSLINGVIEDDRFIDYITVKPKSNLEHLLQIENLNSALKTPLFSNNHIDFAIMGVNKEYNLYTTNIEVGKNIDFINVVSEKHVDMGQRIRYYLLKNGNTNYLICSKPITKSYGDEIIGYVAFYIKESEFFDIYNKYNRYAGVETKIINQSGEIVSSEEKELIGTVNENLYQSVASFNKNRELCVISEYENKAVLSIYNSFFDMYLTKVVSTNWSLPMLKSLVLLVSAVTIVLIIVTIFICYHLCKNITQPISKLIKTMHRSKEHRFLPHQVDKKIVNEVMMLTDSYNVLIEKIDTYVDEILESKKREHQLEIQSLQSQINPHFLYNTLACIKALIRMNKEGQAIESIEHLIIFLQATVYNKKQTVTLREEVKVLKSYIVICKMRFGDQIGVNIEIDENVKQCLIPNLILQPFIENAFFHGFSEKQYGSISIFINEVNNKVQIEIIDTGKGFDVETIGENISQNHIGITNIKERIQLMYGEEYGVIIESTIKIGTTVTITLPYLE